MFDSGVGGLSIANPMLELLKEVELIYVADNLMVPYGNKSEQAVLSRCRAICAFFAAQDCKLIVFACNTATAIAVDACRGMIDIPIVAMEPAIKPAAKHSQSLSIAVCATENTLKQRRFERLIEHYAKGVDVHRVACHGWVQLVENGVPDIEIAKNMIKTDLHAAISAGADTVVLGCTHFPLLLPLIKQVVSDDIEIIDPALAVVQVISEYYHARLETAQLPNNRPKHIFYFTDHSKNYTPIVSKYCSLFENIEFKDIEGSLDLSQVREGTGQEGAGQEGTGQEEASIEDADKKSTGEIDVD
jgi:glutamate racemase